jgi:hypothetical protein
VLIAGATQSWDHRFTQAMGLRVGFGVSYIYTDPHDAPPSQAVLWGGGAGAGLSYEYSTRFAGGRLILGVGANYAPAVDQSTLEVDARVGVLAGARWMRRRLTLFAGSSGVISAEPDDPGALNSVGAGAGAIYDLGAGFALEGGARGAWQTFERAEVVPPSAAVYVALSWNAVVFRTR